MKITIHLEDGMYGIDKVMSVAQEVIDANPTVEEVEVIENRGWTLEWNRNYLTLRHDQRPGWREEGRLKHKEQSNVPR